MFFTLLMMRAKTHSVESSRYRYHDILLITLVVPASPHGLRPRIFTLPS